MIPDRPTAPELVDAVHEFLAEEVLPTATDHRLKFRTIVAMNALAIARRELEAPRDELSPGPAEVADLAARIRAGDVPHDALALLKRHVAAKLAVSNPSYLDRYA